MTRILCSECDGRQIVKRHGALFDCPTCLGRGWTTIPAAMTRRGNLLRAFVGFAAFIAVIVAASVANV